MEGTQGLGVVLGETMPSAKSTFEAFREANINILVQEYVKESGGARHSSIRHRRPRDWRDEAPERTGRVSIQSASRAARRKRSRSRPKKVRSRCRACRALGLNVAGVDMLRSRRGPVLIEVNSTPGLKGIEQSTGIDIAGRMIAFLETHAQPTLAEAQGVGSGR